MHYFGSYFTNDICAYCKYRNDGKQMHLCSCRINEELSLWITIIVILQSPLQHLVLIILHFISDDVYFWSQIEYDI